jgi:hypothetical protein
MNIPVTHPTGKPVVHYADGTFEIHLHDGGMTARLYALNHPHLGAGEVRTSRVLNIDTTTGIIETRNTIYAPLP